MNLDIINIRQKKINFCPSPKGKIDFFGSLLGVGQNEKISTDIALVKEHKKYNNAKHA